MKSLRSEVRTTVQSDHRAVELAVARRAVTSAGELLTRYQDRTRGITFKEDDSLVSEADRSAEEVIREQILGAFPEDSFLGEESGGPSGDGSRLWVVDPLDNSACYVRGSTEYAILVSLLENTRPTLGVVGTPSDGKLYWAVEGRGAWSSDGARLRCASSQLLSRSTVSFASLSTWRELGLELAISDTVARASHESFHGGFRAMLGVASGVIDLCMDPWGKIWDHAALVPVLRESGAVCRRVALNGQSVGLVTGSATIVDQVECGGLPLAPEGWDATTYAPFA